MKRLLEVTRFARAFLILVLALLGLPATAAADTLAVIDAPANGATLQQPFGISGWAIDTSATANTGIDAIHVWAYPNSGGPAVFVGEAGFGPRPDVANAYGAQFANAGYGVTARGIKSGGYMLAVFPHSSITGTWGAATTISVTILPNPVMWVDAPTNNTNVTQPFNVAGWAIDFGAATGTGVNTVHVWAYPTSGAPPTMVGGAGETGNYGYSRPDVAAAYGSQFVASGWVVPVTTLPAGQYDLVAFAHSVVDDAWSIYQTRRVTIDATLDTPTITPAGQPLTNAITVQISVPSGSEVRITRDGTTPSTGSELYGGAFTVSTNTWLRARAFASGWKPSAVAAADYTFTVGTPTLSYPTGQYTGALTVAVGTSTSGASIYWTNDGSDPTESSNLSSGVISVPVGVTWTVKARAFRSGWTSSGIAAATYTTVYPVVQTPTASPAPGVVDSGQSVTLSGDPQSSIRYTTNGSTPTESSALYTAPLTINSPTTVKARAFRSGYAESLIGSWTYSVRTPTPVISPEAGEYASMPMVTIAPGAFGDTVRYTLDRNEPSEASPIYTGALSIDPYATVKAVAFRSGWAPSRVATSTYLPSELPDPPPTGDVVLTGAPAGQFRSVGGAATFAISGALFDPSSARVYHNGALVPGGSVSATSTSVSASGVLVEGRNVIALEATDANGVSLSDSRIVWAGQRSVTVSVRAQDNSPIADANVLLRLLDDSSLSVSGVTDASGQVSFGNIPNMSAVVEVAATSFRPAIINASAGQNSITATLELEDTISRSAAQGGPLPRPTWHLWRTQKHRSQCRRVLVVLRGMRQS